MALFVAISPEAVKAVTTKSPNFEASETEFGAGAALNTCSGSYCARATIGGMSGNSSSANFTADFSPLTPESEPMLEVMVERGESNLGDLAVDRTATRTMIFHVRSFQAGGYTLQINGTPPQYEGYMLATPANATESVQGSEQFALNVVANTTPAVGANPAFMPAEEVIDNIVQPKYAAANRFAYTDGDTVARTASESSQIRYTISMIVNVSGNTPAGHYSGDFSAVVTPVF